MSVGTEVQSKPAVWARRFRKAQRAAMGYLFVAPAVLVFLVYYAYAIVRALWMSFTNYRFLSPETTQFVGLKNYVMALEDGFVLGGFLKAGYFVLLYYPGVLLLPLLVAIVLDRVRSRTASSVYRTLLYVPATIPAALTFRLWAYMYRPTFGLLNVLLVDVLHLFEQRPQWLLDEGLIFPSLALMHWWWAIGTMTVFYLVALGNISQELYESARLDGASELKLVRYVTLPLMRRTMLIWSVLGIGVFGIAAEMLVMWGHSTAGVPNAAKTWAFYALDLGMRSGLMPLGYATAIGWLAAIIMVVMAAVIYLVLGRGLQDY
jgi:ABC-type sugar transport system permease subunit